MESIYGLFSDELCLYIGRTNAPKKREYAHRKGDGSGSSDIPKHIDWKMIILETCDKKNRAFRERYYYDKYMPLYNCRRPYLTQQERDEIVIRDCLLRIINTI